jgi:hypothetical protein
VPHFGLAIGPLGPIVAVRVSVTAPRQAALVDAGVVVPASVIANLLVDTGASISAIDGTILTQLQLQPTGTVGVHTASSGPAPHQKSTYDVDLTIPGGWNGLTHHIGALPVTDGNFAGLGIHGLFGRDILRSARMTYTGIDNAVLLSF